MQPEQFLDRVAERESCIFGHELLEVNREIMFLENFLGQITLENSPGDFWTSGALVIEYFSGQMSDSDRTRTCLARNSNCR